MTDERQPAGAEIDKIREQGPLRCGSRNNSAYDSEASQTGDDRPASAQRMTTYGIEGEAAP